MAVNMHSSVRLQTKTVEALATQRADLLAAAKGVLPLLEGWEHDAGRGFLPSVEALRRAIDKAEGR